MDFDSYKATARREALLKEAEQDRLADIAQQPAYRLKMGDVLKFLSRLRRPGSGIDRGTVTSGSKPASLEA